MSILNNTALSRGLFLAGSLSLYSGASLADAGSRSAPAQPSASALPSASSDPAMPKEPTAAEHLMRKHMEGRAGLATMCINVRTRLEMNEDPEKVTAVTPRIYIEKYPEEGINTLYVEGNEIAKKWEEFLKPKDKVVKEWLGDTDIPDQAEKAFRILKRLDKDKDGIVTKEEFEAGTKGQAPDDTREEMWFLKGLACDSLYFRDGATHQVKTDELPKVKVLKSDLGEAGRKIEGLKGNLARTEDSLRAERNKSDDYLKLAIGLGGLSLLLGVGLVIALRSKKGPKKPAAAEAPVQKMNPPPLPKTKAETPAAAPVSPAGPAAGKAPIDDDFVAELEAQLEQAKSVSGPEVRSENIAVGPDNVIISGPKAEPVRGVDADVVRYQVALHYRRFLSQTAREALQDERPLPEDNNAINSAFEREVTEITERIVAEYYQRNANPEGSEAISELWKNQLEDRGYIVRRGVPQRLLLEVASGHINEHSTSASSPFAGGVGAEMRSEAERHAGESEFLKRGLQDLLRHAGR